jgi:exonuclease VII large subunit
MAEMPLFERLDKNDHDSEERVFRVSEVNRAVRATLEDQWSNVLIEGELSDVRRSQQGHMYFEA